MSQTVSNGVWRAALLAAVAGVLLSPGLIAQKGSGGGGGGSRHMSDSSDSKDLKQEEKEAERPACPEIQGKHLLLEKMTEAFDLTCPQEVKIEPLLHDEESVSKPLLAYQAFTPEEKQAMMLKVKLAARKQIRPLLTPEQQKKSDEEAKAVEEAGQNPKKGGKKGGTPKKVNAQEDAFKGEEDLSEALSKYTAFTVRERQELILQVKQAARRDGAPTLTTEQQTKIDADIKAIQGALGS